MTPITEHIDTIRELAQSLLGHEVRVTTRRGLRPEGELHYVGHASLYVGYAGKIAYGGIESIESLA